MNHTNSQTNRQQGRDLELVGGPGMLARKGVVLGSTVRGTRGGSGQRLPAINRGGRGSQSMGASSSLSTSALNSTLASTSASMSSSMPVSQSLPSLSNSQASTYLPPIILPQRMSSTTIGFSLDQRSNGRGRRAGLPLDSRRGNTEGKSFTRVGKVDATDEISSLRRGGRTQAQYPRAGLQEPQKNSIYRDENEQGGILPTVRKDGADEEEKTRTDSAGQRMNALANDSEIQVSVIV
eukprot:CAMPEP_0196599976 /NCGR_PEP_ID=MMETSP1081-20130531/95141_1 /TAXON_ID=36882 /ORGANISM="Pyramimonas amylifera, Strain CCMP720" /LENGTH=236 /DNA_ID=CAMNT_0041925781 /DNA_START=1216 /DNA_END=1926 /DNA_ORIENTATION=+